MLVALIDIFVIKLFSYDIKDHAFILQTPASTPPLGFIMVDNTRVIVFVLYDTNEGLHKINME
jgi:hypothetical protein